MKEKIHSPRPVVVVMDVTFFGREYGVLVVRDPVKKENLHAHELRHENKQEYALALLDIKKKGYTLQVVVLDGRSGIAGVFKGFLIQTCHFHQWQTMKRYLTTRPKLASHKVLLSIAGKIAQSTELEMQNMLVQFEQEFRSDLNAKSPSPKTGKFIFTHRKLKSAYRSLTRNLCTHYTYQKYPELKIPNTTNSLDGTFSALKMYVNTHRGLRFDRRFKVIKTYLKL